MLRILALSVVASLLGCDALAENPGRNPSTEPHPEIALDCEVIASAEGISGPGVPVEPGSATSVAEDFLARHGLRDSDRLTLEHGPWEPGLAGVRVTRADRTVASVELEREEGGWIIRAFSMCDDFDSP